METILIAASSAICIALTAFSAGWKIGFKSGSASANRLALPEWMVNPKRGTKAGTMHQG